MSTPSCDGALAGPPDWFSSYTGAVCYLPVSENATIINTFNTCCNAILNSTTRSTPTNYTAIIAKPGATSGQKLGQNGCPFLYCDVSYANTSSAQGDAQTGFTKCLTDALPETSEKTGCVSFHGPAGEGTKPSAATSVTAVSKSGLVVLFLGAVAAFIV